MTIQRVFVAGAGLMGHGIAQVLAAAGRRVDLYEPELGRAIAGREQIGVGLERLVARGRLAAPERDAVLERISPTDRPATVGEADLAIEAIPEDLDLKRSLLAVLDARAPGRTILATNTSSISIGALAEALAPGRRPRFLGMHFFSPVPVMPLVEVIRGVDTDPETVEAVIGLAGALGKRTIVSADRPGFIVNRTLFPLLVEAMRVFEEGTGSTADIDAGAKLGLSHPMGPLELADFIGLDVCLDILRVLKDGLGERFAPPRVLEDLVAEGRLGRKTGRGFHEYGR